MAVAWPAEPAFEGADACDVGSVFPDAAPVGPDEGSLRGATRASRVRLADRTPEIAFHGARAGMAVLDAENRILDANPSYCLMAGTGRSELVGTDPWSSIADRHGSGQRRRAEAALGLNGTWAGYVWFRRRDGTEQPYWMTIDLVVGDDGAPPRRVAIWTDMTAAQRRTGDLERLAYYDPVTGLPNRILFRDRLTQAISHAGRSGQPLAVLFLDLDDFKRVNDTLGHRVGDQLLVEIARRLAACLRASDTVSRLAGDEFTVILPDVASAGDVAQVVAKVLQAVAAPLRLRSHVVSVTTSVGIALYPQDADNPDELIHRADSAMYEVKQAGRNGYRFYSRHAQVQSAERMALEQDLRRALERHEFVLHYQPLIDLRTGDIRAVEALVRWRHPRHGLVAPARFIPLAEQSRLIVPLGEWVMREAFGRAKAWRDAGLPPLVMAVNMAAQQLDQHKPADQLARILIETGLEPSAAEIEITESNAMRNPDATIETLLDLKALGIRVAIDDFGTGYSSLSYLQRFPIGALKIDRSFVRAVADDPGAAAIAAAIIGLAHSLDLEVVAEGVETRAQLEFLRAHACDQVQGFLCSRALPEESLVRLLSAHPRLVTRRGAEPAPRPTAEPWLPAPRAAPGRASG
jgi:diguanylate cyclase (GGDEF)-like protein/PAS domain S-box-containing protein